MAFHSRLSDSKSPQISRTLLSIQADLNNVVVWIVSSCLLISKSYSSFINPSVTVPRAPITIGIIITFMFHSFFNYLARSIYLSFFLLSFNFTLWSAGPTRSTIVQVLFFFVVDFYKVWSSGRDYVICLHLKIPEELEHLTLQNRFWVVHEPFVSMVNFFILEIIIITLSRVFHTSIKRWFLTGIWVTANLFKSPELFSVFWLI